MLVWPKKKEVIMLVFELIKNKLINIYKTIKPTYADKTPSCNKQMINK